MVREAPTESQLVMLDREGSDTAPTSDGMGVALKAGGHYIQQKYDARCHVCRSGDFISGQINSALKDMMSAEAIHRWLANNDIKISADSIRNHATKHLGLKVALRTQMAEQHLREQGVGAEELLQSLANYRTTFQVIQEEFMESVANGTVHVSASDAISAAKAQAALDTKAGVDVDREYFEQMATRMFEMFEEFIGDDARFQLFLAEIHNDPILRRMEMERRQRKAELAGEQQAALAEA